MLWASRRKRKIIIDGDGNERTSAGAGTISLATMYVVWYCSSREYKFAVYEHMYSNVD